MVAYPPFWQDESGVVRVRARGKGCSPLYYASPRYAVVAFEKHFDGESQDRTHRTKIQHQATYIIAYWPSMQRADQQQQLYFFNNSLGWDDNV